MRQLGLDGLDDRIAALAERQHGLFTRVQALGAGATRTAIEHRLRHRRWLAVTTGVYRLPGPKLTWHQRLQAAILGAGAGSVASHASAAALWELPGFRPGALEVLRPRGVHHGARQHARSGEALGRIHETVRLPKQDVTTRDGLPVTTPSRTLFDLAFTISEKRLERAVDNALAMGLVAIGDLERQLKRSDHSGRRAAPLRRLLARKTGASASLQTNRSGTISALD
jgi:hypothetical protein